MADITYIPQEVRLTWLVNTVEYSVGDYAYLHGNGGSGAVNYTTPLSRRRIDLYPGRQVMGWTWMLSVFSLMAASAPPRRSTEGVRDGRPRSMADGDPAVDPAVGRADPGDGLPRLPMTEQAGDAGASPVAADQRPLMPAPCFGAA